MNHAQTLNHTVRRTFAHFALLLTAVALALYASGCSRKAEGGADPTALAASKGEGKNEGKTAPTPAPPVEVTTAAAITRALQRNVDAVGSFTADEEVIVAAQAAGELAELNVDFGSFVQAGQVIATIDQRDAKLKIEQAEATLKQTLARLGMKEGEKFDAVQNADVKVANLNLRPGQIVLFQNGFKDENPAKDRPDQWGWVNPTDGTPPFKASAWIKQYEDSNRPYLSGETQYPLPDKTAEQQHATLDDLIANEHISKGMPKTKVRKEREGRE